MHPDNVTLFLTKCRKTRAAIEEIEEAAVQYKKKMQMKGTMEEIDGRAPSVLAAFEAMIETFSATQKL